MLFSCCYVFLSGCQTVVKQTDTHFFIMNLKGQFYKLSLWQKWELKHYAIEKKWKHYWFFKKRYLTEYDQKHSLVANAE